MVRSSTPSGCILEYFLLLAEGRFARGRVNSMEERSDQIRSNQIKSNQIKSNQIKSNQMRSDHGIGLGIGKQPQQSSGTQNAERSTPVVMFVDSFPLPCSLTLSNSLTLSLSLSFYSSVFLCRYTGNGSCLPGSNRVLLGKY
eukprot:jgi/Psemu1/213085/e_gw1.625.33.1